MQAQADSALSPVELNFIKEIDTITESSVHFNVLHIKNISNKSVDGEAMFSLPQNWQIIASETNKFSLNPGQDSYIPIRMATPGSVIGGISYLITGMVHVDEKFYAANSYIFVRSNSKWRMEIDKSKVYLNEFNTSEQVKLKISNEGNLQELIKLRFKIGELYSIAELSGADSVKYIHVKPFSDTIFTFTVKENTNLSYTDVQASKNNWKASTISMEAIGRDRSQFTSFTINQLKSCVTSIRRTTVSPLNYDFMLYNLMSSQSLKMHNKIYGTTLFEKNRSLDYSFNVNNLYFNPENNQNVSINHNLRFMITYKGKDIIARAGDNIGTGLIHSINGRGIEAKFRKNRSYANITAVQNPLSYNRGANFEYARGLGPLNAGIGLTYSDNPHLGNYSAQSVTPLVSFSFLKHHAVSAVLTLSNVEYKSRAELTNDTSLFGFGYGVYYRFNSKNLRINLSNINSDKNYLQNSGINRTHFNANYKISPINYLYTFYERSKYTSTRYPYNFYNPANINSNDHAKILFSHTNNKTVYQIGPQYMSSVREFHDTYSGFGTKYTDYTYGLYSSITYRISSKKSISPNIGISNLNFDFTTTDTLFNNNSIHNQWFYSFGLNYYDYVWRLNVYYTSGSASDLYRNVLTEENPEVTQAFHVRPYYERYFLNNTFRVSGYLNFSYYTPSAHETFTLNLSADYSLKKYWQVFASFNVFSNTRFDDDLGRISSRNFNVVTGFKKAFNIQQPRLKFYDVTISCFNDINGNGIREAEEKPVSNILITIIRNSSDSIRDRVYFPQIELLTDREGQVCYQDMPEGNYILELSPLNNLGNIFFLEGEKQLILINSKSNINIPLVESYQISGSISIERDPNSTEGRISLEGIRITAISDDGYTYSTLTDKYGNYILNLQYDKHYTLKMSNVFNENFVIEQQEYKLSFGGNKSLRVDFRVHEKKRGVQFDSGNNYFDFKLDNQ
ncbi:MAG: hypothetical protein JXB34_05345 [Bacteroidales bacterium]|nr:hypothetical protein [Bacteroidales bacterium]